MKNQIGGQHCQADPTAGQPELWMQWEGQREYRRGLVDGLIIGAVGASIVFMIMFLVWMLLHPAPH